MSKHTPGPWSLIWYPNEEYPYPLSVISGDDIDGYGHSLWVARDGVVSSKANALLIAAAPEMLEALKRCLNFLTNHQQSLGIDLGTYDEFECSRLARAALAKAEKSQ